MITRQATEFTNADGGYIGCLREMYLAACDGVQIDFSQWGGAAAPLLGLSEVQFETLIDLHQEFYAIKCRKAMKAASALGTVYGRKKKSLPENFEEQVLQWLSGKISAKEAAKNCGMPLSSFYAQTKSKKPRGTRKKAEKQKSVTSVFWEQREADTGALPPDFEKYCSLWEAGDLTKDEAAALCSISMLRFNEILRFLGKPRIRDLAHSLPRLFDKAYDLWIEGKITKNNAAALCGLSANAFTELVLRMGKGTRAETIKHNPMRLAKGFAAAYRQYVVGAVDKKQAACMCGVSDDVFTRTVARLGFEDIQL